jgi:hypothetical protein
MKLILLAVAILASFAVTGMAAEGAMMGGKPGPLKHVVSFKFKDSASADDVKKIEQAFKDLQKKINVIRSYDWGKNNSPEGLNKGFTHCFVLTFDNDADRKTYLDHPDHKEFGKMLGPILGDVFVIDFYSGK